MKQQGHVLQLEPLGLWIEEVYHRNEYGVQDGEYDERAPADVFWEVYRVSRRRISKPKLRESLTERYGGDLDDSEDGHPIPA